MEKIRDRIMQNKVILFYGKFPDDQKFDWLPNHLLYLSSSLIKAGFEPVLIPEFVYPNYEEIISANVADTVIFGVSAMTGSQITSGINACRIFREYSLNTPILWGGAHASATPAQTLENEYVDFVCVGPGEESLVSLASALQKSGDTSNILGIVSKKSKNVDSVVAPPAPDLTTLPKFPYHLIPLEAYINPATRVLNYTASRGCPFSCNFCYWPGPHRWQAIPLERVLDEIEWLVRTYDLTTLWLSDSTFMFQKQYILNFAKGLLKRGLDIYWRCNGNVLELIRYSKEELELLKKSGLDGIFVGVESASPRILKLMKKHHTNEQIDTIVERTKDFSFTLYFSFIFGNPTETIEDLEETHRELHRWMKINENIKFQTCIFTPYPGSPMTNLAIENGFNPPNSLEGWGNLDLMNITRDVYRYLPWFSPEFNDEYKKRFQELFPSHPEYEFKPAGSKPSKR
jgi:radical SAM superfamily enzyme YgiQ (UPF0313 family)